MLSRYVDYKEAKKVRKKETKTLSLRVETMLLELLPIFEEPLAPRRYAWGYYLIVQIVLHELYARGYLDFDVLFQHLAPCSHLAWCWDPAVGSSHLFGTLLPSSWCINIFSAPQEPPDAHLAGTLVPGHTYLQQLLL